MGIKSKRGVSSLHLLLFLLHFLSFTASGLSYTNHIRKVGSLRLSRIQRHLDKDPDPIRSTDMPTPLFTTERDSPERHRSKILKKENGGMRARSLNDFGKKKFATTRRPEIKNGDAGKINAP